MYKENWNSAISFTLLKIRYFLVVPFDLLLSERVSFFDGVSEFLDQLIVAFVRRQIETIETGVRSGQPRVFTHFFDTESLGPV